MFWTFRGPTFGTKCRIYERSWSKLRGDRLCWIHGKVKLNGIDDLGSTLSLRDFFHNFAEKAHLFGVDFFSKNGDARRIKGNYFQKRKHMASMKEGKKEIYSQNRKQMYSPSQEKCLDICVLTFFFVDANATKNSAKVLFSLVDEFTN